MRDSIRIPREPAMPVRKEHSEKMTKATTNNGLRLPEASDSRPPNNPAIAHAAEKPEEIMPSCVLFNPRSRTR